MEKLKVGICGWGNVATGLFSALENNADIRHIQKLLGHSSISTTEIYTKVERSRKKVILDTYHPLKNKL